MGLPIVYFKGLQVWCVSFPECYFNISPGSSLLARVPFRLSGIRRANIGRFIGANLRGEWSTEQTAKCLHYPYSQFFSLAVYWAFYRLKCEWGMCHRTDCVRSALPVFSVFPKRYIGRFIGANVSGECRHRTDCERSALSVFTVFLKRYIGCFTGGSVSGKCRHRTDCERSALSVFTVFLKRYIGCFTGANVSGKCRHRTDCVRSALSVFSQFRAQ